jgi:hypothetical protein
MTCPRCWNPLIDLVRDVTCFEGDVSSHDTLDTVGGDSLDAVDLANRIDERFKIDFFGKNRNTSSTDLSALQRESFGEVARRIDALMDGHPGAVEPDVNLSPELR